MPFGRLKSLFQGLEEANNLGDLGGVHKLVPRLPDRKATVAIRHTQFHLTPSWSVTTYKIQGKTVSEIAGDLRVPQNNGKLGKFGLDFCYSYTTLSRVTNWDSLGILCDFGLEAIQQKPPADLLEHMACLEERARDRRHVDRDGRHGRRCRHDPAFAAAPGLRPPTTCTSSISPACAPSSRTVRLVPSGSATSQA